MGFRITFTDNNVAEEGHNIYRSDAPMDPENLPAPLVTLGPDVTEWEDGTVTEGETYYYRVGAFTAHGTVELLSEEFEAEAVELGIAEAVFTFETESRVESPVNWVEQGNGLANSLSVLGSPLAWGLTRPGGATSHGGQYDTDPGYNLGWPADPVVSGQDYVLVTNADTTFQITGLNDGGTYDLSFVGSRSSGSNRTLKITIAGVTKAMSTVANSTETLDFIGIQPSEGVIEFAFDTDNTSNFGYLSAVLVQGPV